jgi:hypothetical protein
MLSKIKIDKNKEEGKVIMESETKKSTIIRRKLEKIDKCVNCGQITRNEYDETVKYYKSIHTLPHSLILTANKNGTFSYKKYDMLSTDIKVILNDYKKAR